MSSLFDQLLVSSPNGGGLFYISKGEAVQIDSMGTTGISQTSKSFHRGLQPSSLLSYGEKPFEGSDNVHDVHDVLCYGGSTYVVGTTKNEIIKFDQNKKEVRRWSLSGDDDSHHINCLGVWNKRIVYSAFGDFLDTRGYKGYTIGAGYVQDLLSDKRIITDLSQPHSLVSFGENVLVANSEKKEIREYSPSGTLIRSRTLDGYTRGILVSGKNIFVGLSRSRNIDDCGLKSATLLVLDSTSWDEIGRMLVPTSEIYSVIKIDAPRKFITHLANIASYSFFKQQKHIEELSNTLNSVVVERDLQVEGFEKIIIDVENNSQEQIAYRDDIVIQLEKRIIDVESNSEKQIAYRDDLIALHEISIIDLTSAAGSLDSWVGRMIRNSLETLKKRFSKK